MCKVAEIQDKMAQPTQIATSFGWQLQGVEFSIVGTGTGGPGTREKLKKQFRQACMFIHTYYLPPPAPKRLHYMT